MNIKKAIRANSNEDYGDTVVCCTVCGRLAIGENGEDFSETVCVDCGNNDWKVLPFTKGADIRQDPNDADVAQANMKKRTKSICGSLGHDFSCANSAWLKERFDELNVLQPIKVGSPRYFELRAVVDELEHRGELIETGEEE